MARRAELHLVLKALFDSDPHVYYQPPSGAVLKYPCIVYKLEGIPTNYADNLHYRQIRQYKLTVIDRDPDSGLFERILAILSNTDRDFIWDKFNFEVDNDFQNLAEKFRNLGHPIFRGLFTGSFVSDNLNHFNFKIIY